MGGTEPGLKRPGSSLALAAKQRETSLMDALLAFVCGNTSPAGHAHESDSLRAPELLLQLPLSMPRLCTSASTNLRTAH